jgi:hypothetical protein
MSLPKLYLGGAMRNGIAEDYEWRRKAWDVLEAFWQLRDPCWGKSYYGKADVKDRTEFASVESEWRFCGLWVPSDAGLAKEDKADVYDCDAGVWNLSALADGYPCIGSVTEIAWADIWHKRIYVIYPKPDLLHPFIKNSMSEAFATADEAIDWLSCTGRKLAGVRYGGD